MKISDAIIECNKRILKAERLRDGHARRIRDLDKAIEREQSKITHLELMQRRSK